MGAASSRKGARAERDAARLLADITGVSVARMLGAGRKEDVGDIHGVPGFTIQVADRAVLGSVLRHKALQCEQQQTHGGTPYGATLMKLPPEPGGKPQQWRFVLTPLQFQQIWEALNEPDKRIP